MMAPCETWGNKYDKAFTVVVADMSHTIDSFEWAIQALAPICSYRSCRIFGHGVEVEGAMYCCAHYASQHGSGKVKDRA
jgi:hypothetical protein